MDELLEALLEQMRTAAAALQAPKPPGVDEGAHAAALAGPKVGALLDALAELRRAGGRLACAREWYGSVCAASAAAAAAERRSAGPLPEADALRAQLARIVRSSLSAAGRDARGADAAEAEEARLLHDGGAAYWRAPLPRGKRCALSLLPLNDGGGEFAELPPTVEWEGKRFHAPLANLWAHCVRDAVPSA